MLRPPRWSTLYVILAGFVVAIGLFVSGVAVQPATPWWGGARPLLGLGVGVVAIIAALMWLRRRRIYRSGWVPDEADELDEVDDVSAIDAAQSIDAVHEIEHEIEEADDFDDADDGDDGE